MIFVRGAEYRISFSLLKFLAEIKLSRKWMLLFVLPLRGLHAEITHLSAESRACHSGSMSFRLAPGAKVYRIEGDAKYVRRNEAELRGLESDDADDGAIDRRKNPPLPAAFSQQDGRYDGKNAGQIIQPEQHRNLLDKSSMSQLAGGFCDLSLIGVTEVIDRKSTSDSDKISHTFL
ncbi:MAG: hypothetical protein WAN65_12410 [Candidatus Sulfotelmatobacter sp.]